MAGGNDYRDMAAAIDVVDQGSITLATTQKALWLPARTLILAKDWRVNKTWKLTAGIKLVTDGTAGNYVFGCGVGTGDAPAVIVVGSSQAGVVSKTFMAIMEAWITCRSIGVSGTVSIYGMITPDLSGVLSTALPYVFPTAGVTVVSTLDMSLNTNAATFQAQRSGAGVWTAVAAGVPLLEALN
jgi:hypothetical protein